MQYLRITFILAGVFLSCLGIFTLNSNPASAVAVKPPEIEVVEISFHRVEGNLIEVDTTLRNVGIQALNGVTAVYHFFAPGHSPITTQRTKTEEPSLVPGAESIIHAQLEEPARAVAVEFSAVDSRGRELRVKNVGPFQIN